MTSIQSNLLGAQVHLKGTPIEQCGHMETASGIGTIANVYLVQDEPRYSIVLDDGTLVDGMMSSDFELVLVEPEPDAPGENGVGDDPGTPGAEARGQNRINGYEHGAEGDESCRP